MTLLIMKVSNPFLSHTPFGIALWALPISIVKDVMSSSLYLLDEESSLPTSAGDPSLPLTIRQTALLALLFGVVVSVSIAAIKDM